MKNIEIKKSRSLMQDAFMKIIKDKVALFSLIIFVIYASVAILSATGLLASNWSAEVGASYSPPSFEHFFGTDIFGKSVLLKTVKATEVAMSVGLVTAIISMCIGLFFGLVSGYFGGVIDEIIVWFYTTVSSVPSIMLLVAITFILDKGILSVYLALGLTSWVSLCRLIRGEVIRHKDREYVHAAKALGASNTRRLLMHITPNIFHIVIINFSLQFQMAIKYEVILSYLGLGVQGRPSWGIMINDANQELARGAWWQLAAATIAMFGIVLAVNLLGDALRDALDPKLKGKA